MRNFSLFLAFLLVLISLSVKSQDAHYSQYFFAPLYLNPAHTGNINGDFRVAANFRSQWWTINNSFTDPVYTTYSGSFDASLFKYKLNNDGFGVGAFVLGDRAGDGGLTTTTAFLSVAYHKATDRFGRHRISFGLQGGITQKNVNILDLRFENQAGDIDFNTGLPSGEEGLFDGPILYPDVNAGVLWTSTASDRFSYYIGASMYHIAQPNETFLNDESNQLNHRYAASIGGEIRLGDYVRLSPSALYMLQSNAQQWSAGAAIDYQFNDDNSFFIGAWTRVNDALIITLGTEYKNFRIGASYDINYSDLSVVTSAQGALELSLIYIHNSNPQSVQYERYCPKF